MLIFLVACAGSDGKGNGDDTGTVPLVLPEDCSALPAAEGDHYGPDDAGILRDVVAAAAPGTTILLEDGTYDMSGGDAVSGIEIPAGVTVRSVAGDSLMVTLEGGYATNEIVTLAGDGATLAGVTVSHAYGTGVAIRGASDARIYFVRVEDAQEVGIGVYPERGTYSDRAVIGCSRMTRPSTCSIGIDVVQADGTWVYGSEVESSGCEDELGMRFATGSRNTLLERSEIQSSGPLALAWGEDEYGEGDERPSDECPDRVNVGHYGGIVRNVFVIGGIRVEDACGGTVVHNSVWGGDIAYAFSEGTTITGNLASVPEFPTDNLTPVESDFVYADGTDLHLADGSAAIDAATATPDTPEDDIDGEPRDDGHPDYGADER